MNDKTDRLQKIFNGQTYYINIRLYNPDGDELILNPQSIPHMEIVDDMHFWPVQGFVVYDNPYEILERTFTSNNSIDAAGLYANIRQAIKEKPYNFRNDGRDFLDITINPIAGAQTFLQAVDLKIRNLPTTIHTINYTCVIYDKEDIATPNSALKMKKFYFVDADYYKMREKNVQWSTATSQFNPTRLELGSKYQPSQATDEQRKMLTGDAIKSLLKENSFLVNDDLFDKGSNKIFYSTFHDKNMWQNIEYLLSEHVSEKTTNQEPVNQADICLFDKERFTQKFQLQPFYKIFNKAGNDPNNPREYQIEHLFFEDVAETNGSSSHKAPLALEATSDKDIKVAKITKYQYADTTSVDNTEFVVTTPVYTYDFKMKTFSINQTDSNVEALQNRLKTGYIQNNLLSKNGTAYPVLTLNQSKTNNDKIRPVYSLLATKGSVLGKGLGRMLYASLFLNLELNLELMGQTFRQSARFVGIDRQTFSDNTFDYKLCGQWFITKVKHVFVKDTYTNEVLAVKFHSYDNLNIRSDVD